MELLELKHLQTVENKLDLLLTMIEQIANAKSEPKETDTTPLSQNETCRYLKCSRSTLWSHIKNGLLQPRLIGGKKYFLKSDLLKMGVSQ